MVSSGDHVMLSWGPWKKIMFNSEVCTRIQIKNKQEYIYTPNITAGSKNERYEKFPSKIRVCQLGRGGGGHVPRGNPPEPVWCDVRDRHDYKSLNYYTTIHSDVDRNLSLGRSAT